MEGISPSNQDFLSEYRAISGKLKKRFLRKPNLSEASQQFGKLGKKLKTSEEPQYEGMCHLAIARCEQSIGNTFGEIEALIAASRCYLSAETKTFVSLDENLAASIQSYNHAIRLLVEKGHHFRASGLCLEIGDALYDIKGPGEALTFYKRAAELRPKTSTSHLFALQKVAECQILIGDLHSALNSFTDMANIAESACKNPQSTFLDILAKCEIYRVLLLLLIQPTPQNLSPNLTTVLEKYAWESSSPVDSAYGANPSPGGIVGNQYLSEEVFLLLQSVVMAVQVRDGNALTDLEDYLVPHLKDQPIQRQLLRELVVAIKNKTDTC